MFCKAKKIDEAKRISDDITRYLKSEAKKSKKIHRLLLLGTGESGKTTIIKQMKIIHINGFSEQERCDKIPFIKQNIRESIHDIVYNMDKINPPVYLENENSKISAAYILKLGLDNEIEYNEDFFNHVKVLWADAGVKECFDRSNEYQLIDSARHFLGRLGEVKRRDYIPTTEDILFCRIKTVTISTIDFNVPVSPKHGGGLAQFSLTDVGGQRGERRKWISVFEGIESILFLIAASDFDQTLREDVRKNRLQEAFELFEDMLWSNFLRKAGMIVFLNKQDILQKKIESGKQLEKYFSEYKSYVPEKGQNIKSEYERAKFFMRHKLIQISKDKPAPEQVGLIPGFDIREEIPDRSIYIHFTTATDTNNIKLVFESVRDIILDILISGPLF